MTKNERMAEIAKNLLADKNCSTCNKKSTCNLKSKEEFNTCLKWIKIIEFDFSINSYTVKMKPRKLNVSWSKMAEMNLQTQVSVSAEDELSKMISDEIYNSFEVKIEEDITANVARELSKWVPKK